LERWLPIDVYFGGAEHTTLHLLYSRFWHRFLYDQKLVPTAEPYKLRIQHGIILASDGEKMSKSRGNVVNPDEIVKRFGADTLRMYELFLGPHGATVGWTDGGILGIARFLERTWRLYQKPPAKKTSDKALRALNRAIQKVEVDIAGFRFNTAISALMILLNEVEGEELDRRARESFAKILAPFAPHIAEELWRETLGNKGSIHLAPWSKCDRKFLKSETFSLVIQINGKVRGSVTAESDLSEARARELALEDPRIQEILGDREPKRVIYVPGRLVNIVI
jgi:leucyl-tRNA synthetase